MAGIRQHRWHHLLQSCPAPAHPPVTPRRVRAGSVAQGEVAKGTMGSLWLFSSITAFATGLAFGTARWAGRKWGEWFWLCPSGKVSGRAKGFNTEWGFLFEIHSDVNHCWLCHSHCRSGVYSCCSLLFQCFACCPFHSFG